MIEYGITNGVKFLRNYYPGQEEYNYGGEVWLTDHIDDAKLFKTRKGAQKVVDSMTKYHLRVVTIEVTRTLKVDL